MNNLRVVIDAGHGGTDPGAVGNDLKEKDLNLTISKYMYERFLQMGIPATLVRSTDETVSPTERVRRILAAYGNDPNVVVISNHINSSSTPNTAEGAEVIYALRNDDTLAKNILEALRSQGQVVRRVYQRTLPSNPSKDYYFIHRETGVTQPLIIEYAFINNAQDIKRLQDNYKRYVDAIVDAVIRTEGGTNQPGVLTYTVKPGDSLWKIANLYNTTVSELKRINNLTGDTIIVGQLLTISNSNSVVSPEVVSYTVQSGDTLWKIAQRYNISVDTLKSYNGLTSNLIVIGQILKIPITDNNVYIVKPGDTLWSIANRYGTTVSELKRINGLTSDFLVVGRILRLS